MICVIHGGQTGVDRGAHEAARENDWLLAGYMPQRRCDERGPIPADVASHLIAHAEGGYVERTEANVRSSDALLVVVPSTQHPGQTPGTAMTLDLARERQMRRKIVDPNSSPVEISDWIASVERELAASAQGQRTLFGPRDFEPIFLRLMIAGPRESRWPGAREATALLLRHVGLQLRASASSQKIA
jgi:Circularly permutated YpsA SLOG family